jgi:transposase
MNAYSKDLRLRVLDALDRGLSRKEVSELFGLSLSTIKRYLKRRREGEDLEPKPSTGRKRRILSTTQEKRALWKQLQENDEATLERHRQLWEERQGVRVSIATMSRAIRNKLGWTLKKRRWVSPEGHWRRSARRMPITSSRAAATIHLRTTRYENRSKCARHPRGKPHVPTHYDTDAKFLTSSISPDAQGLCISIGHPA